MINICRSIITVYKKIRANTFHACKIWANCFQILFSKFFVFLKLEQSTKIWFRVKIWFFVLNALIYRVFYCIIVCIILFFIWKGVGAHPKILTKKRTIGNLKSITSQNFHPNPLERNQSTIYAKYTSKAYLGYTSLILIRLG